MGNYWIDLSVVEEFREKVSAILRKNEMNYICHELAKQIGKKIDDIKPKSIYCYIGVYQDVPGNNGTVNVIQVQISSGRIVALIELKNNVPKPVTPVQPVAPAQKTKP